ncbi:MAG: NAD(P)H-binding protein [Myxococcota bacterium]|nr:NAD(P)H-binding protein [Myxococcota bacterium]
MKILVIGATGGTGRLAVNKLLARGDSVRAFARNPAAITERHDRLEMVKGDARDAASLDRAVQGVDAVLCAFGPRSLKKDDLQETLYRNLVVAMQESGVRRVVNLSAWGAGDSAGRTGFLFGLIRGTLLANAFADKNRGEAILLGAGLDVINVRPGRLSNGPARGGVKASLDGRGIKMSLTRSDLANFMIEQLASDAWLRKSPLIGY